MVNCSVASMSALIALGSKRDASNPSSPAISRISLSVGCAANPVFPCFCALLISRLLTTAALNRRFFFLSSATFSVTLSVFADFLDADLCSAAASTEGVLRFTPDVFFASARTESSARPPFSVVFFAAKRDQEGFLDGTSRERAMDGL